MILPEKKLKSLIVVFIFFIIVSFIVPSVEAVKADTLVIQDNGSVLLLIGPGAVLGATTLAVEPTKKPEEKPKPKTVPIVPAGTKSVITITPPKTNDKKINVTITPLTSSANKTIITITPLPNKPTPGVVVVTPGSATQPSITQTVDSIVAQDSAGNTILDIRSSSKASLTINNQNTSVSTNLPLQINTQTHEFDAVSSGQTQKINVLPTTVVNSLVDTGTISDTTPGIKPAMSLTKDKGDIVYKIQAENQAKLFGVLNLKWPVEIEVSAQTGKTVSNKQPFYAAILNVFKFGR